MGILVLQRYCLTMKNSNKMGSSVFWSIVVAGLGTATAIAGFFLFWALKSERLLTKLEIIEEVQDAGKGAKKEIAEKTKSILVQLTDDAQKAMNSFKETHSRLEAMNNDISNASDQLSTQIKALGSPLEPFKLMYVIEVDYSKMHPDFKEVISNFMNYLQDLGSYDSIRELSRAGRLPDLIIHYEKGGRNGKIISVENPSLKYDGSYLVFENNQLYNLKEAEILKTFFPNMYLGLSVADNFNDVPEYLSDLVYGINYPFDNNPVKMDYRISVLQERIMFNFSVINPKKIQNDNGKIKSLMNCQTGSAAFGFRHNPGLQIIINNIQIALNSDFNQIIGIPLNQKSRSKRKVDNVNLSCDDVFWVKGVDFIQ